MDDKIIWQKERPTWDNDGTEKRTLVERDNKYVLTAEKYIKPKDFHDKFNADYRVGYLIDKDGNITRDLDKAFVFHCRSVVEIYEYSTKPEYNHETDSYYTKPNIEFYKNGLKISAIPYANAEKYLLDRPLPRKGITKLTRMTVYAKYNGRCAYCGCEIEMEEMQVDHLIAHMGKGGEDTLENYMPSCAVCNRVKSNLSIESFKKAIQHCGEIHRKRKEPCMVDSDKIAIKYDLTKENHDIELYFEKYDKMQKVNVDNIKKIVEEGE